MHRQLHILFALAISASAACADAPAPTRNGKVAVEYADLPYVEEGSGATVVLVHGALGDLRSWDGVRPELARAGYRVIAYSQRYHGSEPWSSHGPGFGVFRHADDLAEFIGALNAGPVHLVGWSYGGAVVLQLLASQPKLIKSVYVFEPAIGSDDYIEDLAAREQARAAAEADLAQVMKAMNDKDATLAARALIESMGQGPGSGSFARLDEATQRIVVDNARTMPLLMSRSKAPALSCAKLAAVKAPAMIGLGSESRPWIATLARSAAQCLPGQPLDVIAKADDMLPATDPRTFSQHVSAFLRQQR